MAGRFSITALFRGKDGVSRVSAKIEKRLERMGRTAKRVDRTFARVNSRIAGGLKSAGVAALGAGAAVGVLGAEVVRTGMAFEQSLTNAAAKFPGAVRAGTVAFKSLEEAARDIGSTTEFTAQQAAEGLDFLAMAGFNVEQSISSLPGIVDLATVAQVDLGRASDIATDSLGAFGLMTKDSAQLAANLTRVNDTLAKTTTTANTTIEQMFEAITAGGPAAVGAGASIEQFSAMVGTLANAGIKGEKAGTALRNIYLRLAAPANDAAKVLRKLNVTTKDANGEMRDVTDILGDLQKGLAGLGSADRSAKLDVIFGKRAIGPASILLKSGAVAIRNYTKELEGATGTSKEMAAAMRDTSLGKMKALVSAVEGVKLDAFEAIADPLSEIVTSTTKWVRANKGLIKSKLEQFVQDVSDGASWVAANYESIVTWTERIAVGVAVWLGLQGVVKLARIATFAYEGAVVAVRIAQAAYRNIIWGVTAAQWGYNLAVETSTGSLAANTVKLGLSKVAALKTVPASLKAAGGFATMLIPLAAVAAAIASVTVAYLEWQKLMKQTGGFEGFASGFAEFTSTGDFAGGVDKFQSRQATKKAFEEGRITAEEAKAKIAEFGGGEFYAQEFNKEIKGFSGFAPAAQTSPAKEAPAVAPAQVVSPSMDPQAMLAMIQQATKAAEDQRIQIDINDRTGAAEVKKAPKGNTQLRLQRSGAL